MWVMGQNEDVLIESKVFKIHSIGDSHNIICFDLSNPNDASFIILGTYSSKDKAMSILNKIKESCGYGFRGVIQMPKDDGEETE